MILYHVSAHCGMVWLLFVYARRLATGAIITAENGRMRQGYTTERATFSNIRAAPNTRPYSIQTRTIEVAVYLELCFKMKK